MSETYDLIAELAPSPNTGWRPLFPSRDYPLPDDESILGAELRLGHVGTAQLKYSIAYGIFGQDPDFDSHIDDHRECDQVPWNANGPPLIFNIKWAFNGQLYRSYIKCDTASALTVKLMGIRGPRA